MRGLPKSLEIKIIQRRIKMDQKQEATPAANTLQSNYEPVLLPSKGFLYPSNWTTKGKINVRPMTIKEEKILNTVRLAKTGKALDMIFRACIDNPNNFDVSDLLSGDRSFLLYHLRCISYGAAYEYKINCQNCNAQFENVYNLNDIVVKYLPDNFKEPIEFTLPISKKKVSYRLMRGKDEIDLIEERERRIANFGADQLDNTISTRLSMTISAVDNIVDEVEIVKFVDSMIAGDASALRNSMIEKDCGIDTTTQHICPKCSSEFQADIPLTVDFFRYSSRS
jgi:hypothetical protein